MDRTHLTHGAGAETPTNDVRTLQDPEQWRPTDGCIESEFMERAEALRGRRRLLEIEGSKPQTTANSEGKPGRLTY